MQDQSIIEPVRLETTFKGLKFDDLKILPISEQAKYYNSRIRRSIKRGFSEHLNKVIRNLDRKKFLKIRSRNLIITPNLIGKTIHVYDGKTHQKIELKQYMCGNYIGDFIFTRKIVKHSKAGKGATKSSKFTPLK